MFIHFAFGTLGKQGKIKEQRSSVIEHILENKNLGHPVAKNSFPFFQPPIVSQFPQNHSKQLKVELT
jgi:hypothetical protein